MLTCTAPATGPDTGLLASLGAWTWPGTAADGQQVAHLLLAHRLGRTSHDTPAAIEARMRHLAETLGGLARAEDPAPETLGTLATVGSHVLLRFPGARWGLKLPAHPQWTRLVHDNGRAALVLGLDPLAQWADAPRVDAYLDAALARGRLLFGFARRTSRTA
ncbi:hypothetical protein [Streptomyces sindenensis]|uniref:hypothetical protein n=1 Tax=Streptomyces sindenensis TaxID=67363 RepID=UPI00167B5A28|nr:hypothetical protein [Streptomyces sindenensis]GGP56242.1 hypothetical protein GCM10010231_29060 [Streptomyces sindenensis]